MGAWGPGNFDNDDAADWLNELDGLAPKAIADVLRKVADASGTVEEIEASVALAAAEVVAALKKRPAEALPDEVTIYVKDHPAAPDAELVQLAIRAVQRVGADSGLKELWDESADAPLWREALADLQGRLA